MPAAENLRGDAEVSRWRHRTMVNICLSRLAHQNDAYTRSDSRPAAGPPSDEQRLTIVLVDVEGYNVADAAEARGAPGRWVGVTGPGESNSPDRQAGPPSRGRISMEELAGLDAGLLTAEEEQRLRSRIAQDPSRAEPLAALEQVRSNLGELGQLDDEPVPDDVAARLDAALAAEAATASADTDPHRHARPG